MEFELSIILAIVNAATVFADNWERRLWIVGAGVWIVALWALTRLVWAMGFLGLSL